MKKRLIVSVLITAFLLSLVSVPVYAEDGLSGKKIVAFGDSLTVGAGWYKDDTYVDMLSDEFSGTTFVNKGVRGDTTYNGTVRFEKDVLAENPDIVLICFGMNDQAWEVDYNRPIQTLDRYVTQLEGFIKPLQQKGADVILVTPNPVYEDYYQPHGGNDYEYGLMDTYCNAMRALALKYECGLVDMNYEITLGGIAKYVSTDGIHQTKEGQAFYAQCIGDYLKATYMGGKKASLTLQANEGEKELKSLTVYGAEGANITLPAPEVFGYKAVTEELSGKIDGSTWKYEYTPLDEVIYSKDKTYETVGTKHSTATYQDDGVRLTDGKKGAGDGGTTYYAGFADTKGISVTIDLGEVTSVNRFTAYIAAGTWGISAPGKVAVSYSADGESFTAIGNCTPKYVKEGDGGWKLYEATAEVEGTPVSARYVKFDVTPGAHGFFWCDELEVSFDKALAEGKTTTAGDVNSDGKINTVDLMILKYVLLDVPTTLPDGAREASDVNGDGRVNNIDYMMLKYHILGITLLSD